MHAHDECDGSTDAGGDKNFGVITHIVLVIFLFFCKSAPCGWSDSSNLSPNTWVPNLMVGDRAELRDQGDLGEISN